MDEKKLLRIPEFQKYLGIGANKAYKLANDPSFYPAVRIGKLIRINKPLLDKWLEEQSLERA